MADETEAVSKPIEGEAAGHGTSSSIGAVFGDTTARIGTFNPGKIGYRTFDMMRDHFQVGAGCDLIEMPLTSLDWSVEGPDPRICEYVRNVTEPLFANMMRSGVEAALTGCAPHEAVYERREVELHDQENGIDETITGWVVTKLKDIDPSSLQNILIDGLENFAGYTVGVPANGVLVEDKTWHVAHGMRYGNFWGKGRLNRAYEPWYRFMVIWDQAVRYMEKLATPPTIVYYIPGKTEGGGDNRDAALAVGAGITGEDTHVAMPLSKDNTGEYYKAWDVDLLKDDQRGSMYLAMLEAHAKWMLRALLIPDTVFAQNTSTGSLALSQTHADTYLDSEDAIAREIIDAYNDQIVPRLVLWTFGPDAVAPRIVTDGLTDEKRQFFGELFKAVAASGGVSVAWDKVADRLGVPLMVEDEAGEPAPVEDESALSQARHEIALLAEKAREHRLMLMAHV